MDISGHRSNHKSDAVGIVQAEKIAAAEQLELPQDFLEAAKGEGLRKSVLDVWLKLQVCISHHQ